MTRLMPLALCIAFASIACAPAKQDYRLVARDDPGATLSDSPIVVEGVLNSVTYRMAPLPAGHQLYSWLLGASAQPADRFDAELTVDSGETIPLCNVRKPTADEGALIPPTNGFHDGMRLRLGYSRLRNDRFDNLKIVPLN